MAIRQVVEKVWGSVSDLFLIANAEERQVKVRDTTPVEVTPRLGYGQVSSLDDMRRAIETISREKEAAGGESFEEFWDFGGDAEFADMESMPAPAQMKAHALMEAFTHDFKADAEALVKERKSAERERLKAELRKELGAELDAVVRRGPAESS